MQAHQDPVSTHKRGKHPSSVPHLSALIEPITTSKGKSEYLRETKHSYQILVGGQTPEIRVTLSQMLYDFPVLRYKSYLVEGRDTETALQFNFASQILGSSPRWGDFSRAHPRLPQEPRSEEGHPSAQALGQHGLDTSAVITQQECKALTAWEINPV